MPSNIKDRLSLEYTRSRGGSRSDAIRQQADEQVEDLLFAIGPKVMKAISGRGGQPTSMFQLVDALGESIAVLIQVVDRLRNQGYVDLVSEDPKGDHRLQLTDRGRTVVDS